MKKMSLDKILFWLTLISPVVAFALMCWIGEAEIFYLPGIIRYTWIMWLFIPVGVLSILMGLELKANNQKYKKNLIVAYICIPILAILGSYRFLYSSSNSYDTNKIYTIEEKTNVVLPHETKIATKKYDNYDVSYVKITNNESKNAFESEIENNLFWISTINYEIRFMLPDSIELQFSSFDRFLSYDVISGQYNAIALEENKTYDIVIIAYDYKLSSLMILDNFIINLN